MKRVLILIVISALLLSCGSEEEEDRFEFPLQTGNTWEYDLRDYDSKEYSLKDSVGEIQVFDGQEFYRYHRFLNGSETHSLNPDGFHLFVRNMLDTGFVFLDVDPSNSNIINTRPFYTPDFNGGEYDINLLTLGNQKTVHVLVEAASLNYDLENYLGYMFSQTTDSQSDGISRLSFIPGIGIVRFTDVSQNGSLVLELISFSLMK